MSERANDPTSENYSWLDHERQLYNKSQAENSGQGEYLKHPKPIFDDPNWTPGQREANARMQHLMRGNFTDALAPNFSERFKPGFDPKSVPSSANPLLGGTGVTSGLGKVGMGILNPFAYMAKAEDFVEQAIGKQIWHRESPEEKQRWWLENAD